MRIQESGEMYLEAIHILLKENGHVRAVDVAEYRGYSKPSVSRALGVLKKAGLIEVAPDGAITLTDEGVAVAEKIYEIIKDHLTEEEKDRQKQSQPGQGEPTDGQPQDSGESGSSGQSGQCQKKMTSRQIAKKVEQDMNDVFDSIKEANFFDMLRLRHRAGQISGYLFHGKLVLAEGDGQDQRAMCYEPDFIVLYPDGHYEIIDTKGMETKQFKDKMKILREKYPQVKIKLE